MRVVCGLLVRPRAEWRRCCWQQQQTDGQTDIPAFLQAPRQVQVLVGNHQQHKFKLHLSRCGLLHRLCYCQMQRCPEPRLGCAVLLLLHKAFFPSPGVDATRHSHSHARLVTGSDLPGHNRTAQAARQLPGSLWQAQ
jgi:hypothetical protein